MRTRLRLVSGLAAVNLGIPSASQITVGDLNIDCSWVDKRCYRRYKRKSRTYAQRQKRRQWDYVIFDEAREIPDSMWDKFLGKTTNEYWNKRFQAMDRATPGGEILRKLFDESK